MPANEETPVALPGHAPPAELITGVAQAQAKVLPETQQIAPERSAQAALHVPPEAAQTATFAAPVHKTQLVAVPNTNRSALPAPDTREPVAFVQTETAGENQAPAKVVAQSEMATIKAAPPLTLPLPLPLAAPPGELTVRVQEHSAPVQFGWSDPLTTGSLAKILPLVPGAPDAQRARHVAAQLAITVRSSESSSMELRLDPPELGRVLIQMTTQEGELRAIVTTERAETAELMRRHADILGRELARAGLAGADLSFQSEAEQRQNQRMAESKAIKPLAEISSNHAANLSGVVVQTHLDGRLDIRL
ncbi:MAG: flagellar hook-length control protein FliK [Paracoccaceae bacterium]